MLEMMTNCRPVDIFYCGTLNSVSLRRPLDIFMLLSRFYQSICTGSRYCYLYGFLILHLTIWSVLHKSNNVKMGCVSFSEKFREKHMFVLVNHILPKN